MVGEGIVGWLGSTLVMAAQNSNDIAENRLTTDRVFHKVPYKVIRDNRPSRHDPACGPHLSLKMFTDEIL